MGELGDLQNQLVMNELPYPKYYNGHDWNTIIDKKRRNIPNYLSEDLPPLRFQSIRQQFKKLNSIECPRLSYFQQIITKKKNCSHQHHSHKQCEVFVTTTRNCEAFQDKLERQKIGELKNIREELKYTLMTMDKKSNVVGKLIDRANRIQEELAHKQKRKRRGASLRSIKSRKGCFEDTIDIVLSARKAEIERLKYDDEQVCETTLRRLDSIKLIAYDY